MLTAPFASSEASKFDAAFQRKGRSGLGFSSTAVSPASKDNSTEASRLLLSSSSSSSSPSSASSFSAHAYLQRFGWKAGGGLGKKEDGAQSFLRVSKKADAAGIGAGVAAQAVARSFDSLYNNAARSITVIIQPSSDDDEDAARPSEDSAEAPIEKRKRKKDKKRKRLQLDSASSDESNQLPSAARADERKEAAPTSLTTAPHSHLHRAFRRGAEVLFGEGSESCTSTPSPPPESATAFAGDLLEAHDTERSHLYHDRCQGKLARIRAQEERQHEIVEQIRSKRWAATDERKEAPTDHQESKTERRERRRREGDLRHSRPNPPSSPHSSPAYDSLEKKRRKRDKHAQRNPP